MNTKTKSLRSYLAGTSERLFYPPLMLGWAVFLALVVGGSIGEWLAPSVALANYGLNIPQIPNSPPPPYPNCPSGGGGGGGPGRVIHPIPIAPPRPPKQPGPPQSLPPQGPPPSGPPPCSPAAGGCSLNPPPRQQPPAPPAHCMAIPGCFQPPPPVQGPPKNPCAGGGGGGVGGTTGGVGSGGGIFGHGPLTPSTPTTMFPAGSVSESATDLSLPSVIGEWSQFRSYDSFIQKANNTSLGRNWISTGDMALQKVTPSNDVLFVISATYAWTFHPQSGGTYSSPGGSYLTLTTLSSTHQLRIVNSASGDVYTFWDFSQGSNSGKLYERTTRSWLQAGHSGYVYTYDGSGRINTIMTPTGQDALITYYYASGANRIQWIGVGPTSSEYMKVEYTYKDGGSYASDLGGASDLVQAKTSVRGTDGNWITRYTQYRYFTSPTGIDGKLKMVLESDAIQRAMTALGISTPEGLLTESDNYSVGSGPQLQSFANRSYTYFTTYETTSAATTVVGTEDLNSKYGGTEVPENNPCHVKTKTFNDGGCASCGGNPASGVTLEYHYLRANGPMITVRVM
jgi:hypothetical protein